MVASCRPVGLDARDATATTMFRNVLLILTFLVCLLLIFTGCSIELIKTDLKHPPAGISVFGK
jgi:hypothetical protein